MHTSVQLEINRTLLECHWPLLERLKKLKLSSFGCCQSLSYTLPFEPMILPKVGVIIGVANLNARFVAIVASIQHKEAKIRQFFMTIDKDATCSSQERLKL